MVLYSIEDKNLRNKITAEINRRTKDGLRVNVGIVSNLISKYQNDVN